MRIVAGKYRGRPLQAPQGKSTRPTTDRIREAIMSSLLSDFGDLEGLRVLDVFAGSGAFGLECLSRGVQSVQAFETDLKAQRCIESNKKALGITNQEYCLIKRDVFNSLHNLYKTFDIVFFDPPYDTDLLMIIDCISAISNEQALSEDAVIIYEQAKSNQIERNKEAQEALQKAGFEVYKHKKYGTSVVDYIRKA